MRDMMEICLERGLEQGFELAGAPLAGMKAAFVNGRFYTSMVPLVGGGRDLPLPPKPVMWAMTRLHPAFRRRAKQSITAIDEQFWLQEFARWEHEWKPKLQATNRRLGDVDVQALDDRELATHLEALWAHVEWAGTLHFRLHTSDLAPIGRLLVQANDWGLDIGEVMSTLAGSSPATSAPSRALAEIAAEVGSSNVQSLDDVRAVSDSAARLLDDYLAEFGNRVATGYDIRNRTLIELPEVVLSSIRANADSGADSDAETVADLGARSFNELTEQLVPADRAEFADLVEQARILYGLRDENGPLTVEWPAGILRHAVLETGRRLTATGKLDDIEHVFDATIWQLVRLLGGDEYPLPAELAMHCSERMSWVDMTPPAIIGPAPKLPDVSVLPGKMPEMMRAILMVTTLLDEGELADIAPGSGPASLTGTGIGTEVVRGIARVVADADEAFERAGPGDIIVTRLTVPTFNAILAMSGGVVTEGGGLLSHTAVIARELGIAAVIGVHGALTLIPDGAEIELDPVNGTVTLV